MKALVINCSPVRDGVTARITKIIADCLNDGADVRTVCIDDFDFGFCRGCRTCHRTAKCVQADDVGKIIGYFEWADVVVAVSPSYWADVPGQFKAFIDRCTPWCDTHEPHAELSRGKKGYVVALRTGKNMRECLRIFETVEHFFGHLGIEACGRLGLCSVESREDAEERKEEIERFGRGILR